ncbi:hypothetical protein CDES_02190 [Corynebacterium deserti GIMN1.010]|uniref:Methylase n=1 Tax=Corynebacterium deserti GIMN1.010 TaxID=931089 RepID=A0A0M3Q916_9CORY|nr:class I SAM-dependent methyltransferase [Corynebacterium deserti]ALC04899.1 hypothetical protein CDES_02190 [Corynebacterium deserti GIMN1.010]
MADHAHNLRATFTGASSSSKVKPIGVITRGTTGVNRLRRFDRWCFHHPHVRELATDVAPLALDVGYGASHTTTVEWGRWLHRLNPDMRVIGLEINPERVLPPQSGVSFELGGFELAGYQPQLVRAFNVLRQYDVDQVEAAWSTVTSRLAPGGLFFEGTCDEIGRRCTWITLDADGPRELTLAWHPWGITTPSDVAERLPKILIHRNVPGEKIHRLLSAADTAWKHAAGWEPYGPRVRWEKARAILIDEGWPIRASRRRTSDCLLTIPWSVVSP